MASLHFPSNEQVDVEFVINYFSLIDVAKVGLLLDTSRTVKPLLGGADFVAVGGLEAESHHAGSKLSLSPSIDIAKFAAWWCQQRACLR